MRDVSCFICGKRFKSDNPDDIAGDGKCSRCIEVGKKAAYEVDMKMAAFRRANPIPRVNPHHEWLEKGGPIKARDLGLFD